MPRFGHRSRKGRGSPGSPTEASADRPRNRCAETSTGSPPGSTTSPGREVILVGFSGGAAFAGGLLLDQPSHYSGAAILYGTLPFDAGVPVTPGRLAGIPVFVAQGDQDTVIPRELLDATWGYLTNPSGAPAWATRYPDGHGISTSSLSDLAGWLQWRLAYLSEHRPGSDVNIPGRVSLAASCPNGTDRLRRSARRRRRSS